MKTIIFSLALTMIVLGSSIKGGCQSKTNPSINSSYNNQRTDFNQQEQSKSRVSDDPIIVPVKEYPKAKDSIRQFKEETNLKISKLDKDIAALKLKIANVTGTTKDEYQKTVTGLENKSQELKGRLDNFKYREGVKWNDFKQEMNRDIDRLGNSISDLSKKNAQ
jgi:hypothetical protein